MDDRPISDLGELELIQQLKPFCAVEQLGDDAAVLPWVTPAHPHDQLVVTTDVLVDGVHFSDRTTSPADIGWRAIAVNLSDLAAMGASPVGVTVGLSGPGSTRLSWVQAVYQGMADCLHQFGGQIIGGDVCRSPVASLSITALGRVSPDRVLRRSAAQPGDLIVVTGSHGASRAGLELLLNSEFTGAADPTVNAQWIQAHQRPRPRLDVLPLLWSSQPPPPPDRPIAAMDSSDGLANAVLHLCQQSQVGAQLWPDQIPVPPEFAQVLTPEQGLEWGLYGGEDFELVLSLPPDWAEAIGAACPGSQIIGMIRAEPGVVIQAESATSAAIALTFDQGFQHF